MESIEQTFNGTADFGKKVSVTVSRNGDLITKCYLNAELPAQSTDNDYISEVGHYLMKSCEVEIGGQRIDKHYGAWLAIWSSLSCPAGKSEQYQSKMVEGGALLNEARSCVIPLQFWFCRHTGLALPLIALQYHEAKFAIEFEALDNLNTGLNADSPAVSPSGSLSSASMYVDYVYLDTEERRRFAQISHEYLIEQLQFTGDESLSGTSNRVKLNFNHPVKELIWVCQNDDLQASNFSDAAAGNNPCEKAKLQLNGHDRFSERDGSYFNVVQPYQHHSNIPATGINCYSFALKPEEQQPSGSANMSRIDNATLQLTVSQAMSGANNPVVKCFATNYNVLRIMSGMGGLAYSN